MTERLKRKLGLSDFMGTRNLVCAVIDGEYKIAQYGQWDGYPEGQGSTILDFLRNWDRPKFEENLRKCKFLSKKEEEKLNDSIKKEGLEDKWQAKWPELSRDAGADILKMVHDKPLKLQNSLSFAADSLFCEYAYVLDLDKNRLEVYRGFNKNGLTKKDRFYGIKNEDGESEYSGIRLAKSYSLKRLPTVEKMKLDVDGKGEE